MVEMWRYLYLPHRGERLAAETGCDGRDVEMWRYPYLLHRGECSDLDTTALDALHVMP